MDRPGLPTQPGRQPRRPTAAAQRHPPQRLEHLAAPDGRQARETERSDFEHFYLSIQAASAGLGLAIASALMVRDELDSGQLQAPFGFLRDGSAYHLLSPALGGRRQAPALRDVGGSGVPQLLGSLGLDTERRARVTVATPGPKPCGIQMNAPSRVAPQPHVPGLAVLLPEAAKRIGI